MSRYKERENRETSPRNVCGYYSNTHTCYSDALSVATTLGDVVFPVIHLGVFYALTFEDLFIFGVLGSASSVLLFLLLLTVESVGDFNIGELLQGHRG